VDPVNITKSAVSTRAWPVAPAPVTTWKTSLGQPHSRVIFSMSSAVSGVYSEGLRTTALPAARAGMASPKELINGLFQGPMTPTTPRGTRRVYMLRPSTNGESERIFVSARWCRARLAQWAKALTQ
jgi:hypothetical protein